MKTLHLAIIFVVSIFYFYSILTPVDAFGGFFNLPPPNMANRPPAVALRLYSNSTMPDNVHYLWLRFFDANTNQTFQHVSFFLTISKNNATLLRDLFHTHTGIITLQIDSIDTPFNGTVIAGREPILHGWVPHNDNEPVIVYAPIFNEINSTYPLNIQMFSIDYDNNLFYTTANQKDIPNFAFYLNMREQNQTIISPNIPIPEFPFTVPVLLVSITSLIAFHRIGFRK